MRNTKSNTSARETSWVRLRTSHDVAIRNAVLEEAGAIADRARVSAERFGFDGIAEAKTASVIADAIRARIAEE